MSLPRWVTNVEVCPDWYVGEEPVDLPHAWRIDRDCHGLSDDMCDECADDTSAPRVCLYCGGRKP